MLFTASNSYISTHLYTAQQQQATGCHWAEGYRFAALLKGPWKSTLLQDSPPHTAAPSPASVNNKSDAKTIFN